MQQDGDQGGVRERNRLLLAWFGEGGGPLHGCQSCENDGREEGSRDTRYVQARFLWLQDRVSDQQLNLSRRLGEKTVADLVTRVMTRRR